jgi:nucleotide-binding universal stress UspA family protein
MIPVQKILLPTDFSEPSYEALKTADELAVHFRAELILLHVVSNPLPVAGFHGLSVSDLPRETEKMETEGRQNLDRVMKERLTAAVTARSLITVGFPADEIARVADEEKVGMIVIATHGLSGWRRFVFGSVAEKVIRLASRPVLLIRGSAPEG